MILAQVDEENPRGIENKLLQFSKILWLSKTLTYPGYGLVRVYSTKLCEPNNRQIGFPGWQIMWFPE